MKDFELIVYIIAALIWLVTKNYRKVQQNRPGRQPAPAEVTETQKPVPPPVKRKKEVIPVPSQSPSATKTPFQTIKRQSLVNEYKPLIKKQADYDYLKTEVETTQNFFKSFLTNEEHSKPVQNNEPHDGRPYLLPEDLRKAIIYAEIINRPYN